MDFSKLSDADLEAFVAGNYGGMSSQGLALIAGEQPEQPKLGFVEGLKQPARETMMGLRQLAGQPVQYQQPEYTTAGRVGQVLGEIGQAAPVSAALSGLTKIAPVLSSIAQGAAYGATRPTNENISREVNIGTGITGGALGGLAAKALGTVATGAKLPDETIELYRKARAQGIDVRPDQLTDSKFVKYLSDALAYVPGSGRAASQEAQSKQVASAVSRQIGENTDDVRAAMQGARQRLGNEFQAISGTFDFVPTDRFMSKLDELRGGIKAGLTTASSNDIAATLDDIATRFSTRQPGPTYQAYRTELQRNIDANKISNPSYANRLREVRNSLDEGYRVNLPEEVVPAWDKARREYAKMKTVEKAVPNVGDLTPGRFAQAVRTSDKNAMIYGIGDTGLADIARVNQKFLKPLPDSGTAGRMMALGGVGGAGVVAPSQVLGSIPEALALIAASRGANKVLGSPTLARALVEGNQSAQKALPIGNVAFPALGILGGGLLQ